MNTVSVVIPSFNGQHLLAKNLPAALVSLRDGDELMIVDDLSEDATVEWLRQGFKLQEQKKPELKDQYGSYQLLQGFYQSGNKRNSITLVVNDKNLRFGASCNRGVQLAQHQLVLLLNNDVSPDTNCVQELVSSFERSREQGEVFAVGALEYEGHDAQAPKADLPAQAGKNNLYFARGLFWHQKATEFTAGDTAWVSGGSGLFDRAKWLELGGFDLSFYPAYWEDVDLAFRARQKGWQVLFEPKAVVYHRHESTNMTVFGAEKINKLSQRHQVYFTRKHANLFQRLQYLLWRPYWWRQKLVKN